MIAEGRVLFPNDPNGRPREKKFLNAMDSTKTGFSSILDSTQVGFTRDGTKAFASHFDEKYFTFPKSLGLLKTLLEQSVSEKSLVIDLFAGSSTMAEAIFEFNATSGASIRCISIQIDEACQANSTAYLAGYTSIAEIGKERIRRAGKKLKQEHAGKPDAGKLDFGFRVLKIDSSNMKEVFYAPDAVSQDQLFDQVNNIREDRTAEDLLFQVLLDWGVDLALPIAKETIDGKTVYFVDGNALAACFDEGVSEDFVKLLAKRGPLRVVFRDGGFANDSVKINVEQIFKLMSPSTEVKAI
jgi:adenine-specific DNA-methyltransferase